MDEIDVRMLELLQQDGRMTLMELSKRLSLSRPSVSERLQRLKERGVIERFAAQVSPAKIGRGILVFMLISHLQVSCRKFEQVLAEDEDIAEAHRVTGEHSYVVKAAVADMEALERLVDRLIPYGRVNTSVVLSTAVSRRVLKPPVPGQER